jgi:N-formylglutamate amidohydrolase
MNDADAQMTEAVRVCEPTSAPIPLLLDSPHSGTYYPADFKHKVDRHKLRQAEDAHVDALWSQAPAYGATLVLANYPRTYIDCNRRRDDIDPALLSDGWPEGVDPKPAPTEKSVLGKGLIWRLMDDGEPIYDEPLSWRDVKHRLSNVHDVYYAALNRRADSLHRQFGILWHLNVHSMPAASDQLTSAYPGLQHDDIVLGDRDGTTAGEELTASVEIFFRSRGYTVSRNMPYKGVEIVRTLGQPQRNRHSLQVEVNKRLYMNESSLRITDNFARVHGDVTDLVATLAAALRYRVQAEVGTA